MYYDILKTNIRSGVMIMRLFIGILLIVAFGFSLASANSVAQSHATVYEVVYVQTGDTVWDIAGRFANNRQDVREVVMAIRQANRLNHNAEVYAGQALKVPKQ
jgi:hypothetical protein